MDYILALGGSIICPKKIDVEFLRSFYNLIVERIKQGDRFVIITGGGDVARHYQQAATLINGVSDTEKDWIGIRATHLNGELLRAVFNEFAHPEVLDERGKVSNFNSYSLVVGSGWKPGWSTDYVATQTAIDLDIDNILILSKQDYVYDRDPDKCKSAKPLEEIDWEEYRDIIPEKWTPGLNTPFDPVASRLADNENKKVVIADGTNLQNLKSIFKGESFEGTTIK